MSQNTNTYIYTPKSIGVEILIENNNITFFGLFYDDVSYENGLGWIDDGRGGRITCVYVSAADLPWWRSTTWILRSNLKITLFEWFKGRLSVMT